jgi:DNA-binding Xre family transcriptional regulator
MSSTNAEPIILTETTSRAPELFLMGLFEATTPCAKLTPLGRLAQVCRALEGALPSLTEQAAAEGDLLAWSIPDLTGAEVPEAMTGETISRLRELRTVLAVANRMLAEEAPSGEIDALCSYLSVVLEDLLRHELTGCLASA